MPGPALFLYTDEFLGYNLGERHPLQQRRLQRVHRQLIDRAALAPAGPLDSIAPRPADEDRLSRVHSSDYLDAVRRAGNGERGRWLDRYGLGPGDTPAFDGMYEAARLYAGATVDAAEATLSGGYATAINLAGGLHHAHPDHASGFCTFNDLALGIHRLREGGKERIAYVDIDVHHGDGVQACFWNDPQTLTISLHESGRWLYPGTGFPDEIGGPDARGSAINLPFAPYTGDDTWHEAFDAVVPAVLSRFRPDALVLQLGADAHFADPLAHLQLTSRGWMAAVEKLLALGEGLPTVVTGGGGYNLATVERLWTLATLACTGLPLPEALHDTEVPVIEPETRKQAAAYARASVEALWKALGATR